MEMGLAANKIAEGVMWLIDALNKGIGNYGVAVICFTLILKLAMSPFDVWQKVVMTKNNRAMERMKPQLENCSSSTPEIRSCIRKSRWNFTARKSTACLEVVFRR